MLPSTPCADGTLALPGDVTCQPIMDCGSAPWGDIPVGPDTVYVDAAYVGGSSDGSASMPFTSIQAGVDAAPSGAVVAVAAGTYAESVLISGTPVRLWGRCPQLVTVQTPSVATYGVGVAADGTELVGLAITGPARGVSVVDATAVVLENLWTHDTVDFGIGFFDESSGSVRNAVVERSESTGIYVSAATVVIEDSVVRDISDDDGDGPGVVARLASASGIASDLTFRRSVVERTVGAGVTLLSSKALVEGVVIREVTAEAANGGHGLVARTASASPDVEPDSVVRSSWIGSCDDAALYHLGGTLTVEDSVLAESSGSRGFGLTAIESGPGQALPQVSVARTTVYGQAGGVGLEANAVGEGLLVRDCGGGTDGFGLQLSESHYQPLSSTLQLSHSDFRDNARAGIKVFGSELVARGVRIADMLADPDGEFGRCVQVRPGVGMGMPATADLEAVVLDSCRDVALVSASATTVLRASEIRNVIASPAAPGRGVVIQPDLEVAGHGGSAEIESVAIDGVQGIGLALFASSATVRDAAVRNTRGTTSGLYGDGIALTSYGGVLSTLSVSHTLIEQSDRAALSCFGGRLELSGSAMVCQAFDIDAEPYEGLQAELVDGGDNRCGCPAADGACQSVTANLLPPEPPDSL